MKANDGVLPREIADHLRIHDYSDYRDYLRALYAELKLRRKPYSHIAFTQELDLGESNLMGLVLNNKRHLSLKNARKLCNSLNLPRKHRDFFCALVNFANARNSKSKQKRWEKVEHIQDRAQLSDEGVKVQAFLKEWLPTVLLETLSLQKSIGLTAAELCERLRFPVAQLSVEKALDVLVDVKAVQHDPESGRYQRVIKDLDLGDEIPGLGVLRYHHRMLDLAKEALIRMPSEERHVSSVTLAIPAAFVPRLKAMLSEFERYCMFAAARAEEEGAPPDVVYQLNLQLFPLTAQEHQTQNFENKSKRRRSA